jgi:hypothetical protein
VGRSPPDSAGAAHRDMIVHLLKEQRGNEVTTRCGRTFDRRKTTDQTTTAWWRDVTCVDCPNQSTG